MLGASAGHGLKRLDCSLEVLRLSTAAPGVNACRGICILNCEVVPQSHVLEICQFHTASAGINSSYSHASEIAGVKVAPRALNPFLVPNGGGIGGPTG